MEVYQYFRYTTMPDSETIRSWHDKIKFVPIIALPWIIDRIQEMDSLPRNIPKLIKELWFQYRRENPEKAVQDIQDCGGCGSQGFFLVERLNNMYYPPMKTSMMVLCSECGNWRRHFGDNMLKLCARRNRQELIDLGFDILETDGTYAGRKLKENVFKVRDVGSLAAKVGKKVEDSKPGYTPEDIYNFKSQYQGAEEDIPF